MIKLFVVIFALILLYWVYKKKKDLFVKHHPAELVITTIQASVIQTYLDWDTPLSCLKDDGNKYGKHFKNKNPPDLPHTSGCRCETVSSYYTSADVFQGEDISSEKHPSALGNLGNNEAKLLKQMLMQAYNSDSYPSFNSMLEEFDLNSVTISLREDMLNLVERAFNKHKVSPSP